MTVTIFGIIDCIWLLKFRLCKLAIAFTEICAATLTWIYWCQLKKEKMDSKIKVNFNIVLRKKRLLNIILYAYCLTRVNQGCNHFTDRLKRPKN